jgi:hypothetical protein
MIILETLLYKIPNKYDLFYTCVKEISFYTGRPVCIAIFQCHMQKYLHSAG